MIAERERHAIVVLFEESARRVLCRRDGTVQLPRIRLDHGDTFTRSISRTVCQDVGMSIFVIDWLDIAGDQPICLARLNRAHGLLPSDFAWIGTADGGGWQQGDAAILDRSLQHQAMNDTCPQYPLRRFDALDQLREWYQPILSESHIKEGRMEHWQSGGYATVLRIETDRQTIWLKTVGDEHRTEPSISHALALMSPGDFPAVLAINGKWNAMLLEGIEGPTLNEVPHRDAWLATAERLAEIQLKFISREEELLRAGCADWRWPRFQNVLPEFFSAMIPVMSSQKSTRQPPLTGTELSLLSSKAKHVCHLLADLGVPDTLVHGNFSPHNVIWSKGKPVFLDWAFAIVGFPFLSEEYFRSRMMREHPEFEKWSDSLQKAYYGPWESILGHHILNRAKILCRIIAPLVAATNLYSQDPHAWRSVPMRASVLRSLVRRFSNEIRVFPERDQLALAVKHASA